MRPTDSEMLELADKIEAATDAVRQRWSVTPRLGIILGSGMGDLANLLGDQTAIDYAEVPHFPQPTALGHHGRIVCGLLDEVAVLMFQGRFHLYEGHDAQQTALPVRLLKALGVKMLLVTNAAGGVNPHYQVGDLMLIEDQINLMFANPLVGENDDQLGPRFPDMSAPYDTDLMESAAAIARQQDFVLHRGVYLALRGPTYETRAEYRMARRIGADVVGMSTVPEVVAAKHAGMRVLGLTTITNLGLPDVPKQTTGHEVLNAAGKAADRLTKIIRGVIQSLPQIP